MELFCDLLALVRKQLDSESNLLQEANQRCRFFGAKPNPEAGSPGLQCPEIWTEQKTNKQTRYLYRVNYLLSGVSRPGWFSCFLHTLARP